jgi:hypothetical protein
MYAFIRETGRRLFEGGVLTLQGDRVFPRPTTSRYANRRWETRSGPHRRKLQWLVCLFTLRRSLGTQPQRDVFWLHRLPNHTHQFAV